MNEKDTKETTTTTDTTATPVATPEVIAPEAAVVAPVEAATPEVVETVATTEASTAQTEVKKKCPRLKWIIAAVVAVVLVIAGVLYQLEKEGRSSTTLFTALIAKQEANRVVATVNGETIKGADLNTSIEQFSQMATAQGVDITNPEAQADIRKQALEVLVNTKLLKQEAVTRGVSVTEAEVSSRLDAIRVEIGGEAVLAERMAALGINTERLQNDITDELTIQKLLDQVFAEAKIEVSEEEIASVYEGAGGEKAGFGTLAEVREQVVAQLTASKEQAVIDDLLTKLKEGAEIEEK
jgi:hypothetical protein